MTPEDIADRLANIEREHRSRDQVAASKDAINTALAAADAAVRKQAEAFSLDPLQKSIRVHQEQWAFQRGRMTPVQKVVADTVYGVVYHAATLKRVVRLSKFW
jgi:hypothetical protein